jgi:hypothetical protein
MSSHETYSSAAWLAKHTIVISVTFMVVGLAAMVLALFLKAAERAGAPTLLVSILTVLEYAILIADSLALLCWLVKSAWTFLKEMEK